MAKVEDCYRNSLFSTLRELEGKVADYVCNPGKDFTRRRKLPFAETMRAVLVMEGNSLNKELCELYNFDPKKPFITKSAFVQSRNKIRPEAFEVAFRSFNRRTACNDLSLHDGYRLLAVDGSDVNIAHNPGASTYFPPQSNTTRGFNQLHVNALYDILNNTYFDCLIQDGPTANEIEAARQMVRRIGRTSCRNLVIADRGYGALDLIATVMDANADFLFRVSNTRFIKEVNSLPLETCDKTVSFIVTTRKTNANKRLEAEGKAKIINAPSRYGKNKKQKTWFHPDNYFMTLRIVRFQLDSGDFETLVTSLDMDKFPIEKLKELYHLRWGIETSFRILKYAIGLTNFHAKREDSVRQEIFARLLMYNFCARITNTVVIENADGRTYVYKVNVTQAIHICFAFMKHGLSMDIRKLIAKFIEPVRPGRKDQRKLNAKHFAYFLYRVA